MKTARSTSAGARLLPDRKGHCWYALVHESWHSSVLHEHCFGRKAVLGMRSGARRYSSAHRSRAGRWSLASSLVGLPHAPLGALRDGSPPLRYWTTHALWITWPHERICRARPPRFARGTAAPPGALPHRGLAGAPPYPLQSDASRSDSLVSTR